GAHIGALAIEAGGIVRGEKHRQQIAIWNPRRIVLNSNHFGVAGLAGADLPIGRIFERTAGIARQHRDNPVESFEDRLGAPEASPTEHGYLCTILHDYFRYQY